MRFKVPGVGAIILSIQEIEEKMVLSKELLLKAGIYYPKKEYLMKGILIKTDKGDVKLFIENNQMCCEDYGCKYLETPDDINSFIGAKLISVKAVDIKKSSDEDDTETQLKITTSKGVLQYAVYNIQNGYYSHVVFQQVFDKTDIKYY